LISNAFLVAIFLESVNEIMGDGLCRSAFNHVSFNKVHELAIFEKSDGW
jgi:hypothetical protein